MDLAGSRRFDDPGAPRTISQQTTILETAKLTLLWRPKNADS